MITAKIPYSFLIQFGPLRWKEIEFGLSHNYTSSAAAIMFAQENVKIQSAPSGEELAIADSQLDDSVLELVRSLSVHDTALDPQAVSSKWLCILLGWISENEAHFADPLGMIEELYSDFDYPDQIKHLVRYMPTNEPSLGSKEQNERRLIDNLHKYAQKCKKRRQFATEGIDSEEQLE